MGTFTLRFVGWIALTSAFTVSVAYAATYTTIRSGNWNDITSVWSTDGVNPCSCWPGNSVTGHTINVLHDISLTSNIRLGGGNIFYVKQNISITGNNFNIDVYNANMNIEGNVLIKKFVTRDPNAYVFVNSSGTIQTAATVEMYGGLIHVRSAYVKSTGQLLIDINSTFKLTDGSKAESSNSVGNYGIIDIGAGCCVECVGTWQNNPGATVLGLGSARSTAGNVRNEAGASWSAGVSWCAFGGGSYGLPTPMNCPLVTTVCSGIILPVYLSEFRAELKNELYTDLNWKTASENNNAFFRVMKLSEGKSQWEEIEIVNGHGTTDQEQQYRSVDNYVDRGVTYYRLIQVNTDGDETFSDIVSVNRSGEGDQIIVYPNPAEQNDQIVLNNLKLVTGNITIYDISGNIVQHTEKQASSNYEILNTDQLSKGIYNIYVTQMNETEIIKLVIK